MPAVGKRQAARVAASFRSGFEGIKLDQVVGIYGGVDYLEAGERARRFYWAT